MKQFFALVPAATRYRGENTHALPLCFPASVSVIKLIYGNVAVSFPSFFSGCCRIMWKSSRINGKAPTRVGRRGKKLNCLTALDFVAFCFVFIMFFRIPHCRLILSAFLHIPFYLFYISPIRDRLKSSFHSLFSIGHFSN